MKEKSAVVMIETLDGRAYVGASLKDAVQQMRASAWACPETTLRAYMAGVSRRVMQWNKQPIRSGDVVEFVNDLEAAGIIVVRNAQ
jgi:hypothetical protein